MTDLRDGPDESEQAEIKAMAAEPYESETALVIREERDTAMPPASILPSPREWEASLAVAREIASTQFVPESYRGRPDAVLAAILTGREMGIGPMQSLRQIHMIDGRPAFAADLMMAKMRQGGVVVLESRVTDEGAYIKAKRKDTGEETDVEWTKKDAEQAGLLGKKNWKTYPTDMYWARAVGRLARKLGSDLLGGLVYSKEEMEDWDESGYGGAPGYDASTTREFDWDKDLMPNAIAPKDAAKALVEIEPTIEWPEILDQLVKGWRDLSPEMADDFWRRVANAATLMSNAAPAGTLPPDTDQIKAAFAQAFSGINVDVVYKEAERPPEKDEKSDAALTPEQQEQAKEALKKDDDVEFGEDK